MNSLAPTKNFSLRKFIKNRDEEALYQALGEPEVVRHMATPEITEKDCQEIIQSSLDHWNEYGIGSYAVEAGSQIVGWAGFKRWTAKEFELLIVLSPSNWGLGKDIFRALVQKGKNEFGLESIVVLLPDTRMSYRYIVKKGGFQHMGKETFNGEPFQKFELSLV